MLFFCAKSTAIKYHFESLSYISHDNVYQNILVDTRCYRMTVFHVKKLFIHLIQTHKKF